jgi:hypothetical protein
MEKFRFTDKSLAKFDKSFLFDSNPDNHGTWFYTDTSVEYFKSDYTGERSASDTGRYYKSFSIQTGNGGVIGIYINGETYVPTSDMSVTQLINKIKSLLHGSKNSS